MSALRATRLEVSASPAAMQDWFEAQGWTDGLPVVPPTVELVEAMVAGCDLAADAAVGALGPSNEVATVEKIAINAVMAGCRPLYMPVLVAAVRALSRPEFNLAGIQATTHSVAPLLFVNGPVRGRIGLNCGANVLGQGFRANATIGRAVRLLMMNIGGGLPGKTDMSTFGSPAKFSYCGGENEEASPWEPFHVSAGMAATDSAVLLHGGEAPHNINDHASKVPRELLMTIASSLATVGTNNAGMGGEMLLMLGQEHARILAGHGMSKTDVQEELYGLMRLTFAKIGAAQREFFARRRPAMNVGPEVEDIPYVDNPSDILLLVAGGDGLHSMAVPSFGAGSRHVMERIA
jgi:hypothetical protein